MHYLKQEGKPESDAITVKMLLGQLNLQLEKSLESLRTIDPSTLTHTRMVGRAHIASTQLGLLVHAAEHTMRHVGQLLVTVRFLEQYASIIQQG